MDAVGYTGSVGTMLFKDLGQSRPSHLSFLRGFAYGLASLGALLLLGAGLCFARRKQRGQMRGDV